MKQNKLALAAGLSVAIALSSCGPLDTVYTGYDVDYYY